jgi:hypothetical protein
MIGLASETLYSVSHILEFGVVLSTLALVLVTAGLWYATAQVHKDEINKMTDASSHANDNMTEVALAEIRSHHEKIRHINQLKRRKGHF